MKNSEMLGIKNCRKNLVGFMNLHEIDILNELFCGYFDTNKKSFYEVCDKAIELLEDKMLNNKQVTNIFNALMIVNDSIKTESHRYSHGKIYVYDEDIEAYIFLKRGTCAEFKKLNHYLG